MVMVRITTNLGSRTLELSSYPLELERDDFKLEEGRPTLHVKY
jgi:hypothetical protein